MGLNQGLKLLERGSERKLTDSEVRKGYIFITNDKAVRAQLERGFDCSINGKSFLNKKIDNYGRIGVGREVSRSLETKKLKIKLLSGRIEISTI